MLIEVAFGALKIDVALQISNKILFEQPFGDALKTYFILKKKKKILDLGPGSGFGT